ncbi:succinate dehydrogenase flavoprotein subunit [Paenibacillus cisolokensis]|uniref:Succinate dehydrogenase flavoprotein subunit n=1 Tax=Paenibacillus cisolokensis TaxID=1658519 RepID=A0ABQ4NAI1_9BACL|nr:FAD-dependent oxidoreductase [Paenibacillus cisolokensis]GIQ65242.1 succinate dehydrogenase flavoprotein subunit [Paenibacillus cisolokensis]
MVEIARERYDVVIIGSGGAGLRAALAAAEQGARPVVLTKGEPQRSGGTLSAHYSFCAVVPSAEPGDSPELFAADIIRSGEGIPDPRLVQVLAEQAAEAVAFAERLGVKFDPVEKGSSRPHLGWLAGHSYARALHVGNTVGRELMRVLLRAVKKAGIPVHSFTHATDLIVDRGVLKGVAAFHSPAGELRIYEAPAVIVATGGGSQIYELNTNPYEATGDGYGIALRAGIELVDMEFVQHYPTVLVSPAGARGLMFNSGILIPKGARLLNRHGDDFWDRYGVGPLKDATRDVMSRVMSQEIAAGNGTDAGGLYISTRGIDPSELPQMQQRLLEDVGLAADAAEREVAPGAHYFMGGLRIEPDASTSLPGVYAAGECAGGIHGANRLAGNALSENQVFGAIAGRNAAVYALRNPLPPAGTGSSVVDEVLEPVRRILSRSGSSTASRPQEGWREVQSLMQRHAGATRTAEGLEQAIQRLNALREEIAERVGARDRALIYNRDVGKTLELRNMVDTGWSVAASAKERRETRGAHVRLDAPESDNGWTCSLAVRLEGRTARFNRLLRGEVNHP